MKRKAKKLGLHRETVLFLGSTLGGQPPTPLGSECEACITLVIPDTNVTCQIPPTGAWSACPLSCGFCGP